MDNLSLTNVELKDEALDDTLSEILSVDTDVLVGMGRVNEVRAQRTNKKMHQRTLAPA